MTKKEIEKICDALVSTFNYWNSGISKDKHREQLQACFRMALELGILIGENRRFEMQEDENEEK